ncbi:MAG: HD domain-containing protein [bacterium]|nr:HD domain-containing protein [bacterium]
MSEEDRSSNRKATEAPVLAAAGERIVEATEFAWRWHGLQTRKGRTTSYMSHLAQVQGIVIDAGGGPDEVIAALLHDALEDAASPDDRTAREHTIETRFGRAVLTIVLDCSDTTREESAHSKGPWRERKERYLAQLRAAAEPSRLVAACDKRQNLADLVSDLRHEGPATLERFNAGAAQQIWYFESLAEICRPAIPARLARELDDLMEALRELVAK